MTALFRAFVLVLVCAFSPLSTNGQANSSNEAGVIIDFGNGDQTRVVVPFEEESISSIDLLEQSGVPMLKIGFGGLGDAVCMIETVGCDVSSCRRTLCKDGKPNAPFWQFLQQEENGSWSASPLGASSASVENGDIDAWLWTGTVPELPAIAFDTLIEQTGFVEDGGPALYANHTQQSDDALDRTSLIVGGGLLTATLVLGAGLVFIQRRKHAAATPTR